MKQKKDSKTKKTLLSSIIVLIVCVAMLLGTTFAWFTDSVSNTGNRIQAGKLDVDLLMYKMKEGSSPAEYAYQSIDGGTGDIFKEAAIAQNSNETLWEPGKTQVVYLAVQNKGNLAFKFKFYIDVIDHGLCDDGAGESSLEYAVLPFEQSQGLGGATTWSELYSAGKSISETNAGTVYAGRLELNEGIMDEITKGSQNETEYFALFVHMKEDAGNVYQDKHAIIDVYLQAAQYASEKDGFDNPNYDANASYDPEIPVKETVTKTVDPAKDTEFNSGLNPASTSGGTSVVVPAGGLEAGTATMTFETQDVEKAQKKFVVSSGKAAVAGIDLTVKLNGTEVTTFNDKAVRVTTYIVKGLTQSDLNITYNGSAEGITLVSYDTATGKLVYTTTHFSDFCVDSTAIGYFPSTNTAYYTINAASGEGGDFKVFRDFDVAANQSITKSMNIDMQNHTMTNKVSENRPIYLNQSNISVSVIDGKIVDATGGNSYGVFDIRSGKNNIKLNVSNVDFGTYNTDSGAVFKNRGYYSEFTLVNVKMTTNHYVFDGNNGYNSEKLTVKGGEYYSSKNNGIINIGGYDYGQINTFTNVKISGTCTSGNVTGCVGTSSNTIFDNCDFNCNSSEGYCVAVAKKASVTINSGKYVSKNHAVRVMTSGGTANILGGTFTTAEGKSVLFVNTESEYMPTSSVINVQDGTFTGGLQTSSSSTAINVAGGTFNKVTFNVSDGQFTGGTFDADPTSSGRIASGYAALPNGTMPETWTISSTE